MHIYCRPEPFSRTVTAHAPTSSLLLLSNTMSLIIAVCLLSYLSLLPLYFLIAQSSYPTLPSPPLPSPLLLYSYIYLLFSSLFCSSLPDISACARVNEKYQRVAFGPLDSIIYDQLNGLLTYYKGTRREKRRGEERREGKGEG